MSVDNIILVRLLFSFLLGGMIGVEREIHHKSAGFRTHILVCVGSTLFTLASIYTFKFYGLKNGVNADPARIAAQIVSGIGFLGAGTIMREGNAVRGLTTAASLWVVAGIGLAVGSGFYAGAIYTTAIVFLALVVFGRVEAYLAKRKRYREIKVRVIDRPGVLGEVCLILGKKNVAIKGIDIEDTDENGMLFLQLKVEFLNNDTLISELTEDLMELSTVKQVKWNN